LVLVPDEKGAPNHNLIGAKEVPIAKGFSFNYLARMFEAEAAARTAKKHLV
jgi:hypothetical protein